MITLRNSRSIVFSLICVVVSAATMAAGQAQSVATNEAAVPYASAEVQNLLAESNNLADANNSAAALKIADEALAVARRGDDNVGQALAQQARAKILHDLVRNDEALAEWQAAANSWAKIGYAPGRIPCLVQAAFLYLPSNKEQARGLFAQGLALAKTDTKNHNALAKTLYDLGEALSAGIPSRGFGPSIDKTQKQAASDYLKAALDIMEKIAPDSMLELQTLNALARVSFAIARDSGESRDYSLAKGYSIRAVALADQLAPDSAILVDSLCSLGKAERQLSSDGADARAHYLRALQIQRKLASSGSVEEIEMLGFLAGIEQDQSHLSTARDYLTQAITMGERIAPESKQFEFSLEVLGVLEVNEGDPGAAREHLKRALAIREKAHAPSGAVLLYLGSASDDEGDFTAARDYFERALSFLQETSPNAPEIGVTLENLSQLFDRQGDFISALQYGRRALAFAQEKEGDSPNTARCLGVVGDALRDQRKFDEAVQYYQKSLSLWEKLVPDSLDVAYSLNRLSNIERARGDLKSAADYNQRALAMGRKSCPNSWCVVDVMVELGEIAYEQGNLPGAHEYFVDSFKIREASLGSMHPLLAGSLNDLALVLAAEGKNNQALADALRAESIGAEHLRISARSLPERQALAYEESRASGLDVAITLAEHPSADSSVRNQVFDAVIRSRALVFDELANRHRSAYGSADPKVRELAEQLSSSRARLATLVIRGPGDSSSDDYHRQIDDARERKEEAERALAEKSVSFRHDLAAAQWGLKDIAAALPNDTALIAYVRFARRQFSRVGVGTKIPKPVPSYAAFVLSSTGSALQLIPLGPAGEIDRLLDSWRRDVLQRAEITNGADDAASETISRRTGVALRRKIWDPVAPFLGNAKQVFIVPDGALHLGNLSALPSSTSSYLIETGPLIHYLSAERDLVPGPETHGDGILVVGNPAFDQDQKLIVASVQNSSLGRPDKLSIPSLRGTRSACGAFHALRFAALPASQREAENITALWTRFAERQPTLRGDSSGVLSDRLLELTGQNATLEMFARNAPGKRVLHVATHGFFLEDNCDSASQPGLDSERRGEDALPAQSENPLLLSGLAFAGANRRTEAKSNESDGILTAEEIAGMNLEGVDWAVLSACNTGLGKIQVGEGVFGLRRAFQVAGAKTVIMSLWPVEDETARTWMTALYREHFSAGRSTSESVRAASLSALRQRRAKHLSTNPFYWAPFIAAGDWH